MEWLRESIPWATEPNNIVIRRFFFYFIGSCLFGNNRSMLTCKLLGAMRVVLDIGAYDMGDPFLWILYLFPKAGFAIWLFRASRVASRF